MVMARAPKPKAVENTEAQTRVFGYARVSTDEQELGMQLAALEHFDANIIIKHEKVSAASKRRHQLGLLWKQLQRGDTLVVWRMDRLARDTEELLWRTRYLRDEGIKFVSLIENIDTSTAAGVLHTHMLAAFAEFERNTTKERTRSGLKHLQDQGVKLGKKPMADAKKEKIRRDLLNPKFTNQQVADKHGIALSSIPYLFPGGRRAVVAAAEKAKRTRKALKAAMREVATIWSLSAATKS